MIDILAIGGLVALLLGWLAIQRVAVRSGSVARDPFRCGACHGDCGGRRTDCPRGRVRTRDMPDEREERR